MRRFKSQLFADATGLKDDPALIAVLDRDSAHVGPRANGGHVTKIQKALETIERVNLGAETGTYGTNTVIAVKSYKDSPRRRLLQPGQLKADEFVGKRTIKSLDEEMFRAEPPRPPSPTPTPVPVPPTPVPVNPGRLFGAALARLDAPLAVKKVDAALKKLREFETALNLRIGPIVRIREFDKVTESALNIHFRLVKFDAPSPPGAGTASRGFPRRPVKLDDIKHIILHFDKIRTVLLAGATSFQDGVTQLSGGKQVAAEAGLNGGKVTFSLNFRNFTAPDSARIGPNSRAAILIHEGFHAVDSAQRSADDIAVHISEFDARYDRQAADDSLFNPSSYASFAAQAFAPNGKDPNPRFGLGPGRNF